MVWVAIFFLLVETLSTTDQVSQKWQRPFTKGTTAHRQHLYCNPCDQAILLPLFFGKQKKLKERRMVFFIFAAVMK